MAQTLTRKTAPQKPKSKKQTPAPRAWLRLGLHLNWGPRQTEVASLIILVIAMLTLLALAGVTRGAWIDWWTRSLRWLFGWGAFAAPLLLGGFAYGLLLTRGQKSFAWPWGRIVGGEIAFFCALGLLHTLAVGTDPWQLFAEQLGGGGLFGWSLAFVLMSALGGRLLAALVLSGLMAGGLALVFQAQVKAWVIKWIEPSTTAQAEPRKARQLPLPEPPPPPPPSEPPKPRAALKNLATPEKKAAKPLKRDRHLPPLDLLEEATPESISEEEIKRRADLIRETLRHFGLETNIVGYSVGPAITQYAVEPGFIERPTADGGVRRQKVRVGQIASLSNDLALALAAPTLRIEAPVPGHSYVGIEVPNPRTSLVSLRSVMESAAFRKIASRPLAVALGKDVSGQSVVADLALMPHLLIAGTTGSGKSVCINALITCLVLNNQPEDLRLVMIDPKMVELVRWNGLPHLYGKVETDLERIVGVLRWVTREMDGRYKRFAQAGSRNLEDYNTRMARADEDKLPRIVVLIDELADLMMLAPVEVEKTICRIAQMARATGIHLVMATQRPSTDVVTGLIKANFPARISFAVASSVDSRVILDSVGAETLLGKGDMLYQSPEAGHPVRLQGCYVSDREIEKSVRYWRDKMAAEAAEVEEAPWEQALAQAALGDEAEGNGGSNGEPDDEQLLQQAIALVRRQRGASASMLQRKMRIGYPKAARLIDQMEEMGIIGPPEAAGRLREVLLPPENDD